MSIRYNTPLGSIISYTLLSSLKALIAPTVNYSIGTLSKWFKDIKALDDTLVLNTKWFDINGYSARKKLRDKMLKESDNEKMQILANIANASKTLEQQCCVVEGKLKKWHGMHDARNLLRNFKSKVLLMCEQLEQLAPSQQ